jgi:hypothetical protein
MGPRNDLDFCEKSLSLQSGKEPRFLGPSSRGLVNIPAATSEDVYCPCMRGRLAVGAQGTKGIVNCILDVTGSNVDPEIICPERGS